MLLSVTTVSSLTLCVVTQGIRKSVLEPLEHLYVRPHIKKIKYLKNEKLRKEIKIDIII